MEMKEITKLLGVETLDEAVVTEVETKLTSMVNEKVDTLVQEKAEVLAKEISEKEIEEKTVALKEELQEEYGEKFDDYKDSIAEKFSLYVDEILQEKLVIPENIMEYAKKGELYSDLIEQFKLRIGIDEGLVDEEAKSLLSDAKDEILRLKDEKNELTEKYLDGKKLLHESSSVMYLYDKCSGLTESQKERVMSILEGITDKEVIDKKFDIIVESFGTSEEVITEEKITVKVVDPKAAVSGLKKAGVKATVVEDNKVSFDTKDKKKAVA